MLCITYKIADGSSIQLFASTSSSSPIPSIYSRGLRGSNAWSEWSQIYDTSLLTNSTALSSLASALGAYLYIWKFNVESTGYGTDDWDSYVNGIKRITSVSGTHAPQGAYENGYLFSFMRADGKFGVQIYIELTNDTSRKIWVRTKFTAAGNFNGWMSVTLS